MAEKKNRDVMDWYLDKMLSKLPNDPVVQTRYVYYLSGIITSTLLFFSLSNFYSFFTTWNWTYLFGGLLTACFFLMSLFSFNATRNTFKSISKMSQEMVEKVDENLDSPAKWEEELKQKKQNDKERTQKKVIAL